MRLINIDNMKVEEFLHSPPPYAILSHVWGSEEVSFADMKDLELAKKKSGFAKILHTAELARKQNLKYIWVDTCCKYHPLYCDGTFESPCATDPMTDIEVRPGIDKSSSAELSEAINSMFAWYKESEVCYTWLEDVEIELPADEWCSIPELAASFHNSCWFKRGWTLQELLAPTQVEFYSRTWNHLGNRHGLVKEIHKASRIDTFALTGGNFRMVSIARRMYWACDRSTTRPEDTAYSLLGIFDVNMTLLYGEGEVKAFRRLQEEILKTSTDQSVLAWEMPDLAWRDNPHTLLAERPSFFSGSRMVSAYQNTRGRRRLAVRTGQGFCMSLLCATSEKLPKFIILDCQIGKRPGNCIAIALSRNGNRGEGMVQVRLTTRAHGDIDFDMIAEKPVRCMLYSLISDDINLPNGTHSLLLSHRPLKPAAETF
jgi:hypothetical protein